MTTTKHVKRVTLTSKKNWWMVELDDEQDRERVNSSANSFSSSETAISQEEVVFPRPPVPHRQTTYNASVASSPLAAFAPGHPSSIFSFPTPTAYAAPPNPTADLEPVANGSASELFKCIVKKPAVIQLEINGEMQSNVTDVTTQFLAELRVYTTVSRHRNIATFLGCLEGVGMVLEWIDGRTLYDVVRARPPLTREQKIDYHDQLLDGLTHLHQFGLSHGDLSLLNVQVTTPGDTVKLLDFGRSVAADSMFASPDDGPVDPFMHLRAALAPTHPTSPPPTPLLAPASPQPGSPFVPATPWKKNAFAKSPEMARGLPAVPRRVEQIHPGTRPFAAPEILRGECADPRLADAYSFGMVLVCLDRCESVDVKPWDQRKDLLPKGFLEGCEVFRERCEEYLRRCDRGRRRLVREDRMGHVGEVS